MGVRYRMSPILRFINTFKMSVFSGIVASFVLAPHPAFPEIISRYRYPIEHLHVTMEIEFNEGVVTVRKDSSEMCFSPSSPKTLVYQFYSNRLGDVEIKSASYANFSLISLQPKKPRFFIFSDVEPLAFKRVLEFCDGTIYDDNTSQDIVFRGSRHQLESLAHELNIRFLEK